MKIRNQITRQKWRNRNLAFVSPRFVCLVFSMLFLILPVLGAQTDTSTENPLPETSDADPNAIPSTPDGDSDVTELLTEDKKIVQEKEEKVAESPPLSTPAADPNAIPSAPGGDADVTELLAEDKKNIAKKAPDERMAPSDPNQIQKADPNSLPVSDPNEVAPETSPSADPNLLAGAEGSRDVTELLAESKERLIRQWVEDDVIMKMLTPYTKAKTYLHEEWELDTAMEHTLIYQRATGGRRPREQAVYNFTWFGVWNFSKYMGKEDAGVIGFSFEERDNITDHSVKEFSQEVGVNYRTHGLNTNERSRTAVRQLWWRRTFLDKTVTATAGKLHHPSFYNRNSFAGNSRTSFLSNPFSRNPNRLMPQDGLGANVTVKPNDDYYLSAGLGDAEASNTTTGFSTAGDGHLFLAAEIGLTPTIEGFGQANYRFTFWHTNQADDEATTDDDDSDGGGVALSFDQELNKTVGLFARYGYTEPQVTDIKNFVSSGFVLRDAWGFKDDLFGVGLSWDQPSNGADDEYSMEVFQRFQVTSRIQVTPSVQVIFDPSQSEKNEPVAVFGIRFRALF